MPAILRLASASDIDQLVALENAAFSGDRLARPSFRRLIAGGRAALLVAERRGRLAGYALALFRQGSQVARLYSVAVHPDVAGMGIGGMLLAAAEAAALGKGRVTLRLEVREDNIAALRLYEREGYRPIGRIADYYQDGAAALRFEKTLGEPSPAKRVARPNQRSRVEERTR